MVSVVIYSSNSTYLNKTIDSLLDSTSLPLEVVVCIDDHNIQYSRKNVTTLTFDGVGKAKAFNSGAERTTGDIIVFIGETTKFKDGWLQPIVNRLEHDDSLLVSPVIHTLDVDLWSLEPNRWRRFGWRWDLNLYDRQFDGTDYSAAASDKCIVCLRSRFEYVGKFDEAMSVGAGFDVEFSLRNWLFGGEVVVEDESVIGSVLSVAANANTVNNLARIVEMWMPQHASHFYNSRGIKSSEVRIGNLNGLRKLSSKQSVNVDDFINMVLPELFGVYKLRNFAAGKTVSVVGCGPSVDYIKDSLVANSDVVIGVDYAGLLYECDYVLASSINVANELGSRYKDRILLPTVLDGVKSSMIFNESIQFQADSLSQLSSEPPFFDCGDMSIIAIQLALFMKPSSIMVFGCDNKLINNKSHTSRVEFYNGGAVYEDSEHVRKLFALNEYYLDQLGRIANGLSIPLLRVMHA